ncbi:hypothetical protein [Vibrio splendidus]|uniref:hypothetical protein n=1 Tax=Vibrio splendidus TaxID=29497 RepID=UPI003D117130
MNKILTLGLTALFFVFPVMAKVTLADVYKADEAQRAKDLAAFEQYKLDHSTPLSPPINPTDNRIVGHWTQLRHRPAGASFVMLSGSSTGAQCAPKGVYGYQGGKSCSGQGSKHYECHDTQAYYHCE